MEAKERQGWGKRRQLRCIEVRMWLLIATNIYTMKKGLFDRGEQGVRRTVVGGLHEYGYTSAYLCGCLCMNTWASF